MKEKLRVLFFLRRIGPYHNARFQAVKGLFLMVVETRPDSIEYPWEFNADGDYIRLQFPEASSREAGLKGVVLQRAVESIFNEHTPDVVVTTGWADQEYHAVVLESSRRAVPRVIISDSRYEDEPRRFYKEWIKYLALKSYSAALVAGTSSRNYLVRLGVNPSSIFIPWDVVDNDFFGTLNLEQNEYPFDQRDFLCISRFIEKKNIIQLLNAFAIYREKGGKRNLRLLGSGELEDRIKDAIKNLTIQNHVTLHGFVQYEGLRVHLSQSVCLILPSLTDQWGLVVNEAMASGVPALVSTNCGCAIDLVDDSKNGYIIDPGSADDIADKMILIGANEDAWVKMSVASRVTINHWTPSAFSEGLTNACACAKKSGPKKAIVIVHKLLAR